MWSSLEVPLLGWMRSLPTEPVRSRIVCSARLSSYKVSRPYLRLQCLSRLHSLRLICEGHRQRWYCQIFQLKFNPLKPELNPICYLLALLAAHHFLHVSRIRVKLLTCRLLMSYIYIYGAPILDVSRSHTTTQHSR